jgi:hypothetical protein
MAEIGIHNDDKVSRAEVESMYISRTKKQQISVTSKQPLR